MIILDDAGEVPASAWKEREALGARIVETLAEAHKRFTQAQIECMRITGIRYGNRIWPARVRP